jgi:hypothetical protein
LVVEKSILGLTHSWFDGNVIFVWGAFGFRESPYTTEPVPATEEGDQLLVGREDEIKKLESRISACSKPRDFGR